MQYLVRNFSDTKRSSLGFSVVKVSCWAHEMTSLFTDFLDTRTREVLAADKEVKGLCMKAFPTTNIHGLLEA